MTIFFLKKLKKMKKQKHIFQKESIIARRGCGQIRLRFLITWCDLSVLHCRRLKLWRRSFCSTIRAEKKTRQTPVYKNKVNIF
jgi:hypothetical protein